MKKITLLFTIMLLSTSAVAEHFFTSSEPVCVLKSDNPQLISIGWDVLTIEVFNSTVGFEDNSQRQDIIISYWQSSDIKFLSRLKNSGDDINYTGFLILPNSSGSDETEVHLDLFNGQLTLKDGDTYSGECFLNAEQNKLGQLFTSSCRSLKTFGESII